MIVPRLWARLGNQCFMLSAAIAHAKKMATNWASPINTLDSRIWPLYFNNLPRCKVIYELALRYNEKRHAFDELPHEKDMVISGYFQSEKYFINAKEEIGNALGFHCNKQDYIAVHVRRGDYLQYQDQFPVLPIEYYRQAISEMILKGFSKFIIYSDDQDWCRNEFFTKYYNNLEILLDNTSHPLTAMRDMYNAAGFIIANSTFSLFPALLRLDNPIVVAPNENRWYGIKNKHLETQDLMPERFIKI